MIFRRIFGAEIAREWNFSRVGKDAEPAYWMGGIGSQRPVGATGIRFAVMALDAWQKRESRLDALQAESRRNAERGRLARWAAGGSANGDRYGKNGEPLLKAPKLSTDDLQVMRKMRGTLPGKLAYGACVLATAIELQRCWKNSLLDDITIRINLDDEVYQIASIAASIHDAETALGPAPSGELAKDSQVADIYTRRRSIIDERIAILYERVQTLNRYWDNLKNLDTEIDRLKWIRQQSTDDGRENTVAVEQERQQLSEATRQTEDAEGISDAVVQSLIDDAHHILKLNEDN